MASRPKAPAKAAASIIRRRQFLQELADLCMPSMVVKIDGKEDLAIALHADGLIQFGQDTTSITASGREWLEDNG